MKNTTEIKTESNYLDLVRDYFPNISDEEADNILWTKTPFPMRMDEKEIGRYLSEYRKEEEQHEKESNVRITRRPNI